MFQQGAKDIVVLNGNIDIYSSPDELKNWMQKISTILV
jgi:hypothetical protein